MGYLRINNGLDEEQRGKRFPEFLEQLRDIKQGGIDLFDKLDNAYNNILNSLKKIPLFLKKHLHFLYVCVRISRL